MEYEDYTQTSKDYDSTRVPVGIKIVLEVLAKGDKALSDQVVLDAGCGTGNYLVALAGKVGQIYGLDLNAGMLVQAKKKTKSTSNVTLDEGAITDLPYELEKFDGVICNQVIHHVTDGDAARDDYATIRQVVTGMYGVLKPGGALIFNTSTHEQCRTGFWWASLIPEAVEKIIEKSPSIEALSQIMQECGFERMDTSVPKDAPLQGEAYFDALGPLKTAWRDGDSTWSLATKEELERAIQTITSLRDNGGASRYFDEHDAARAEVGQTTCVFGYKP